MIPPSTSDSDHTLGSMYVYITCNKSLKMQANRLITNLLFISIIQCFIYWSILYLIYLPVICTCISYHQWWTKINDYNASIFGIDRTDTSCDFNVQLPLPLNPPLNRFRKKWVVQLANSHLLKPYFDDVTL